MRLIGLLGLRHLRARPARAGLLVCSVALGVAVYFAVAIASSSTVGALDDRSGGVGDADLVALTLGASTGGPEELVDALGSLDGVERVDLVDPARFAIALVDGTAPDAWIAAHEAALRPFAVLTAAEARREAGDDFRPVQTSLPANSLLALLVGGYLIYLTFTTATLERIAEYGILRAIGTRRRAVLRLVVAEAVAAGAVGVALGLVLGALLASTITDLLVDIADVDAANLVIEPAAVAGAVALGLLAPLVAAVLPARRAARLDPLDALRGDVPEREHRSRWWMAGAASLAFGIGLVLVGRSNESVFEVARRGAAPLLMVGAILIVPRLIPIAARVLRPVAARLVPGAGSVAVQHLGVNVRRSAYTAALAMIAIGSVVGFGVVDASWRPAVDEQVDRQFGADLVVTGATFADLSSHAEAVAKLEGIDAVTVQGRGRTQIVEPSRLLLPLLAIDPDTHFAVSGFVWESANASDDSVASGIALGGVALPEVERAEAGARIGEPLTIAAPNGRLDATVVASYLSFGGGDARSLVMDVTTARSSGLLDATDLLIRLDEGADPRRAEADITGVVPADLVADITSTDAAMAAVRDRISSVYVLVTMVVAVMLIVGVLAIASTVTVSVLQRTREIGLLRAVGARKRAIHTMVLTEAIVLTAIAIALGSGLGVVIGWTLTEGIANDFRTTLPLRIGWAWLPAAVLGAAAAAMVASVAPARRAASIDPVVALHDE